MRCRANQMEVLEYVLRQVASAESAFLHRNDRDLGEVLESLRNMASVTPVNLFSAKKLSVSLADAVTHVLVQDASINLDKRSSLPLRQKFTLSSTMGSQDQDDLAGDIMDHPTSDDVKQLQAENDELKNSLTLLKKQNTTLKSKLDKLSLGKKTAGLSDAVGHSKLDLLPTNARKVALLYLKDHIQKIIEESVSPELISLVQPLNIVVEEVLGMVADSVGTLLLSQQAILQGQNIDANVHSAMDLIVKNMDVRSELITSISLVFTYIIKRKRAVLPPANTTTLLSGDATTLIPLVAKKSKQDVPRYMANKSSVR